jgi:hypothetical protein
MENISDDDGYDFLRTTVAAVAVTVIASVYLTLNLYWRKASVKWVKILFQRRQWKGSYEMLLRELKNEDPDSFRSYLRMDIDSFDHLLNLLKPHISGSERYVNLFLPMKDWL